MNIYPFLPLSAFLINLISGSYILFRDSKNKLNILYSFFTFSLAIWSLGNFFTFSATTSEIAVYWGHIAAIGAAFTPAFLLHFFLVFSKNKHIFNKKIYIPIYLPLFIFIIIDNTTTLIYESGKPVFWGYTTTAGILYNVFALYIIGFIIAGLFVCYSYYKKSFSTKEKNQAMLLIISIFIPFIGGIFTQFIPNLFALDFIPLTTTLTTFTSMIVLFVILKYKLMTPRSFNIERKLIAGFLIIIIFSNIAGYFYISQSQESLKKSIGETSILFASTTLDSLDQLIYSLFERWESNVYSDQELLKNLAESNTAFDNLTNIQNYIDEKNEEWISIPEEIITPFMQDIINNEQSHELELRADFYAKKYGYNIFPEIFITNKYGVNVAQTRKTSDYYQADEEWWLNTKRDGSYIGDFEYDRSSSVESLALCIRIDDSIGNFSGIIKIVLDIKEISIILDNLKEYTTEKYNSTELTLITNSGKIIYSSQKNESVENISSTLLPIFTNEIDSYDTIEGRLYSHVHSKGYNEYEGHNWVLIVQYDTEEIFTPIHHLTNTMIFSIIVVTILTLLLSIFISRSFSKPIITLKNAADEIAKGNYDISIDRPSNDEVGLLTITFNKMVQDIKKSKAALENINKNLERKVDERTKELNEKITTLRENEAATLNIMEDLQETKEMLQVMNRDLERKVKDRTAEIHFLLNQKDEFINQLGHDLKNPLTPLMTLLPLLKKHVSDTESLEYFDVVIHNVQYMKSLVTKTLELARLNSPNTLLNLEDINLTEKINDSLHSQKLMFETRHITLDNKIRDTIIIQADTLRFEELLKNLLNNAVKFTPEGGRVTLDAKPDKDYVTVSIQDTGIGLTKEQTDHIFDEFYKVDESRHDFDSSGLGLPICKRITEKHGGKIWVESDGLGKGSTFYFTMKTGQNVRMGK